MARLGLFHQQFAISFSNSNSNLSICLPKLVCVSPQKQPNGTSPFYYKNKRCHFCFWIGFNCVYIYIYIYIYKYVWPLCEIQAKVSQSSYEITTIKVWFQPLIGCTTIMLENQQKADNLNEFYCRFKKNTPHPPWTPLQTTVNTSSNLSLPRTCNSDQRRRGVPGLPEAEKEKSTRPRQCHTSLSEIMCWPAGLHLHKYIQQITGNVRSPFMLQTLRHHPHPKETQTYMTKWLQTCGSNVCGHEVIWKTDAGPPEEHHWTLAGFSSVCLQSKQVCRRCSKHGTALCSATSRQTRDFCEHPVCGLQLGI